MDRINKFLAYFFVLLLLIFLVAIIAAPIITDQDPLKIDMKNTMAPPSEKNILGTDILGRDLFARILYGGRVSVLLALIASTLSLLLGGLIGFLAGYYGGTVDRVITMITSIFQGLPGTCMMLAIAAMLGPGVNTLIFAMVITNWANFSRIVRGEIMKTMSKTFIDGAKSLGASNLRVMLLYILPDIFPNMLIVFSSRIASTVLSIAGLSYLGLGVRPPTPDWGVMVSEARTGFRSHPMLIIAPGLAILILSLGINYASEILRDRLVTKNIQAQVEY